MEDPTTIALNLTFFGTLGVAFVMFVGLFLIFVATLIIAGAGRLAAVLVMALFGRLPREDTVEVVHLTDPHSALDGGTPARPAPGKVGHHQPARGTEPAAAQRASHETLIRRVEALSPGRLQQSLKATVARLPLMRSARPNPAEMSPDWAAAVARADARAKARARAEAAPQIAATVPDPPVPVVPTGPLTRVAPLVESAIAGNGRKPPGSTRPSTAAAASNPAASNPAASNPAASNPAAINENATGTTLNAPAPRSFVKPRRPGHEALLETGSLTSLAVQKGNTSVKK